MVREMKKRGCKEVGGNPWDKMIVKEGIVLCKRTGELVGFEHLTINSELNMGPNNLQNEDGENTTESSDSDSIGPFDSDSDTNEMFANEEFANPSKKAKLICQFFYSSKEGDFSWPVASFPLKKLTTKFVLLLYGKYICEAIGSLDLENGKRIEVIYGVADGSTYSHAFFNTAGAQNWVRYNPFNDQKPIWWLSDYPHMIKKLRNFIVNPDRQLEKDGKKITGDHLIPVVKRQLTKLNWKHLKLTARTKMSVKRAVTLCSNEVSSDILKGPLPPEETVATRTYIKQSGTNCLRYLTTNERLIQSVIKNC